MGEYATTALLTNSAGDVIDIEWGNVGDVSVNSLCSFMFENEYFILGSQHKAHQGQIAKVENCQLTRIGTLPKDLYQYSCAVAQGEIYAHGGNGSGTKCYKESVLFPQALNILLKF